MQSPSSHKNPLKALPFLMLGMIGLVLGMWTGLERLGLLNILGLQLSHYHGPLMVSGFLGTLISLERAFAIHKVWAWMAPLCSGIGALMVLVLGSPVPGILLMISGSIFMTAIMLWVYRKQPEWFNLVMAAGALCWLTGNILWISGWSIPELVGWWIGFPLLTITGERLELNRIRLLDPRPLRIGLTVNILFLCGLIIQSTGWVFGRYLVDFSFILIATWLIIYDMARDTIRNVGLTRYMAVCLMSGYFWLLAGGIIGLTVVHTPAGPLYDARLHSIFLGFVFSMIFAHAPVIFPLLTGRPLVYRKAFYAHWVVLQASLIVRIWSDLAGWQHVRAWSGAANVLALLIFIGNTLLSLRKSMDMDFGDLNSPAPDMAEMQE